MNPIRALLVLLALSPALMPEVAPAAPAPRAAAAPAQQKIDEFIKQFRQAMQTGATDEMNRLVRIYPDETIFKIVETCELIADGPNESLEELILALSKSWKAVHQTGFPDHLYEYFSLMRPEIKEHRKKLTTQYHFRNREFREAEAAKDKAKFAELGALMKDIGNQFEQIGDYYYASQSYLQWGKANDEGLRGPDADLKQAHDGLKKCVELREKIELKDAFYHASRERWLELERRGYGEDAVAPPPPPPGNEPPPDPSGPTVPPLATTFEVVPDVLLYRRPLYSADEVYATWSTVTMLAKGTSAGFTSVEKSPKLIRTGAAEVMVDVDLDGQGDIEVPLTGNIMPVQVTLGTGDQARPWAFLAAIGTERDTYQGIQPFNLAPADEVISLYVAPAASLVAVVDGTPIRVIDDNMDGKYGSPPITLGYIGLVEGNFQPDVDTVVIGESTVAVPWSEKMKIGESWYRMEVDATGQKIGAAKLDAPPETGILKLAMKDVTADWLIVKGQDAKLANCYFNLLADKAGVQVPAGRYELLAGQVSKGKKDQMAKALVLRTQNTPVWTVEPGKTTTVALGGPFKFNFKVDQGDEVVTIRGDSISVLGSASESYQRFWNCVPRPEVSLREQGKKRGSQSEDMTGPGSQEEVSERGFKYAWFPFDLELAKEGGKTVEVQLVEKKNKLFGKIESDWR